MPGTLFVVATPIGNLEDITARALRVLREAALIAAEDTRRTAHLLARYAIRTPTTSLHEHNETKKAASIVARLLAGDMVALVSDAGTPTISDPGQRLIQAAIAAGIRIEPIPGPSASIAALAVSGFPTDAFAFLGFPPTRSRDLTAWLERLRTIGMVAAFYEAPHRIRGTLEHMLTILGDCQIVVGRELTKAHEEILRGPISNVLSVLLEPKGEFTVIVDIGRTTESIEAEPPPDSLILAEFGEMTNKMGFTRRQILARVAARHRMTPNDVYQAVERAKKSV